MKQFLVSCIFLLSAVFCHAQFANESLSFRVTYKWGIIQKEAGTANLKLTNGANDATAVLTCRTHPWADLIFMVRDTLVSKMRAGDMAPIHYDKSTHEEKQWRHDILNYHYSGGEVTAHAHRNKIDDKGIHSSFDKEHKAPAPAVDMVSVYYFVRQLPFNKMKAGTTTHANVFSAKTVENLDVTYHGEEKIKLNGRTYDCYKISFTFSSERFKNSSKPMKAWLLKSGTHIPVKLEGELTIGKIQVLYNDPKTK